MIKSTVVTLFALLSLSTYAQNTFPSSGNVGIGTTAPLSPLHVIGNTSVDGILLIGDPQIAAYNKNGSINFDKVSEYMLFTSANWTGGYRSFLFNAGATTDDFGMGIGINAKPGSRFVVKGAGNGSNTSAAHILNSDGSSLFFVRNDGNIGIGATSPTARLHINGSVRFEGNGQNNALSRVLVTDENGTLAYRDAFTLSGAGNWSTSGSDIFSSNSGFVGIGTSTNPAPDDTKLKLAVSGNIYAQKLKITQTGWADYVFDPRYKLLSLEEVENYIQKNKHLPGVISAATVEKIGVDVGENQAMLLKKIEELTLYIIRLNKEIELLKQQHQ